MYLYGASGLAKVIIDILESSGIAISGLLDDNPLIKEIYGKKDLGKYERPVLDSPLIINIADNHIRAKIKNTMQTPFGKAFHSKAVISPPAKLGEGTVIMQGAIVQADARIGKHVILNTNASVDHDCIVGDFAHISPGTILCGGVQVGEGTPIGVGAVVVPGIKIGKWCRAGGGAVGIEDIPDFPLAFGNRAKFYDHPAYEK